MFKKLTGIPLGSEPRIIPFSMNRASYTALNSGHSLALQSSPVAKVLEHGELVYRLNDDRTLTVRPRFDGFEDEGWKVFTFEGVHDDIFIIDIDHYTEKVLGYNLNVNQFFHVKMYLSEYGARFNLHGIPHYLSDFLI